MLIDIEYIMHACSMYYLVHLYPNWSLKTREWARQMCSFFFLSFLGGYLYYYTATHIIIELTAFV